MPLKSVIREDPSQIRVIGEEDAKHVPDFPLVPVGAGEDRADGLDGGQFVCVGLDADARVETKGQQVVHNLENKKTS